MAETDKKPLGIIDYYGKPVDINTIEGELRQGWDEYVSSLSGYDKESLQLLNESFNTILNGIKSGKIKPGSTQGQYIDNSGTLSLIQRSDLRKNPKKQRPNYLGHAFNYFDEVFGAAKKWVDPSIAEEEARKKKEEEKKELQKKSQNAFLENVIKLINKKIFGSEDVRDDILLAYLLNTKRGERTYNALKNFDISAIEGYSGTDEDKIAFNEMRDNLVKALKNDNNTYNNLSADTILDYYDWIPYYPWLYLTDSYLTLPSLQEQYPVYPGSTVYPQSQPVSPQVSIILPSTQEQEETQEQEDYDSPSFDEQVNLPDVTNLSDVSLSDNDRNQLYTYLELLFKDENATIPVNAGGDNTTGRSVKEIVGDRLFNMYNNHGNDWMTKEENSNWYWIRTPHDVTSNYRYWYNPVTKLIRRQNIAELLERTKRAFPSLSFNISPKFSKHGTKIKKFLTPATPIYPDDYDYKDVLGEFNPWLITWRNGDFSAEISDPYKYSKNTNGDQYDYGRNMTDEEIKSIESNDLYKEFFKSLIDDKGDLTDVGKAYAEAQLKEKWFPENSVATIYDPSTNKIRIGGWEFKDSEGHVVKKYNTLKDLINGYINNEENIPGLPFDHKVAGWHNIGTKSAIKYYYLDDEKKKHYISPDDAKKYNKKDDATKIDYDKENNLQWYEQEVDLNNALPDGKPNIGIKLSAKPELKDLYLSLRPRTKTALPKRRRNLWPAIIGFFGLLPGLFTALRTNRKVAKTLDAHLRAPVVNPPNEQLPITGDYASRVFWSNEGAKDRFTSLNIFATADPTLNYLLAMHGNKSANEKELKGFLADNNAIATSSKAAWDLTNKMNELHTLYANLNLRSIFDTLEKRGNIWANEQKENGTSLTNFFNNSRNFAWNWYTHDRDKREEKEQIAQSALAFSTGYMYQLAMADLNKKMKEAHPDMPTYEYWLNDEYNRAMRQILQMYLTELYALAMNDYGQYTIPSGTYGALALLKLLGSVNLSRHGGKLNKRKFNI